MSQRASKRRAYGEGIGSSIDLLPQERSGERNILSLIRETDLLLHVSCFKNDKELAGAVFITTGLTLFNSFFKILSFFLFMDFFYSLHADAFASHV